MPVQPPVNPGMPSSTLGPFDCPTVPYPGGSEPTPKLSPAFSKVCATCHGGQGEGKQGYPALPGRLSLSAFTSKVRSGTPNMPAFDAAVISDEALSADYEALMRLGSPNGQSIQHPSLSWSSQTVEAKRAAGLKLWRKADKDGVACANCHTPDAIDLALIGYRDEDIMRRGLLHLAADDVIGIIDFVHAQRRHFKITSPCSPDWRVFQPGGTVLAGATAQAQDESFLAELERRKLMVVTQSINSEAEAEASWKELAELNLRRLPIGIALPRWTEDRFHGEQNKSINDWISAVPRVPSDGRWYTRVDAYLADPTEQRLLELLRAVDTETNDQGYAQKPGAEGDLSAVFVSKYHSAQLASHFMRMALQGKPSWYELSEQPQDVPITRGESYNAFNAIGFAFQENHCYNQRECPPTQYRSLPEIARVEFDPVVASRSGGTDDDTFQELMRLELTHPWWTLSGLFDPTFGAARPLVMHYWLEHSGVRGVNFPQRTYHRPFLAAEVLIKRSLSVDRQVGGTGAAGILDGRIVSGFENTIASTLGTTKANTFMINGLIRTILFRMKASLSSGGKTSSLSALNSELENWPTDLERVAAEPGVDAATSAELRRTAKLAREVLERLSRAPSSALVGMPP